VIPIDIPPYAELWTWIAAIAFGVLGGARLTRLIVHDHYPPAEAVREWWVRLTWDEENNKEGRWGLLATCHWCASPYVFAIVIASAYFSHMHWFWWLFWGWLAGSYLTAMVVEHDEKD
jgi:hypothetical protein